MPALPFDDATSFSPPPAFGPYRVLHQIGSGVLGPVFRTYDSEHDRLVAVKAFRLDVVPEQIARLADALRRVVSTHVAHAAIVAPIEAGLEGTTAFLAMEYVAAETLDVALRHLAPAPLAVAVPLLRQMAEAIDAAWRHGPSHGHGALHPRDVFVAPGTNEVRITGFGVVPALESIGVRAPVRRPYTAPERTGSDAWDVRADVFALGALAHELLTGRRPAGPGEQDGALPAGITPEVRVRIRRVLSAALAEKPQLRFASATAFVDALDGVGSDDVLAALPVEIASESAPEQAPAAEASAPEPRAAAEADPEAWVTALGAAPLAAEAASPEAGRSKRRKKAPNAPPPEAVPDRFAFEAEAADTTDAITSAPVPEAVSGSSPADSADLHADTSSAEPLVPAPVLSPAPLTAYVPPGLAAPTSHPWGAYIVMFIAGAIVSGVGVFSVMTSRHDQAPSVAAVPATPASVAPSRGDVVPPGTDVQVTTPVAPAPGAATPAARAQAAPAKATTGRLAVTSTPAGASVLVDGVSRGRTPLTIRGLSFSTHTVVVARPGYKSETRRVPLFPDAPAGDVTVDLTRLRASPAAPPPAHPAPQAAAAKTGSIDVDSRPSGATVFVDGKRLGVTPLRVPGVPVGSHTIRLELAGFKSVTSTLVVAAGDPTRFTVTLEQAGIR